MVPAALPAAALLAEAAAAADRAAGVTAAAIVAAVAAAASTLPRFSTPEVRERELLVQIYEKTSHTRVSRCIQIPSFSPLTGGSSYGGSFGGGSGGSDWWGS